MPKSTIKLCKHKAGETELRKIELGFTSLFRNSLKRGRKTLLRIPQFFPDSEAQILQQPLNQPTLTPKSCY